MLARCRNPNATGFARYGGRGIKVCERWQNDFAVFLADVGPRPSPEHTLDREDADGDYEPGNAAWATPEQQANNRRDNRRVLIGGQVTTLRRACREAGSVISIRQAWRRIKAGWPAGEAVSTPPETGPNVGRQTGDFQ